MIELDIDVNELLIKVVTIELLCATCKTELKGRKDVEDETKIYVEECEKCMEMAWL